MEIGGSLDDWVPFGIRWEASNPVVDWCYMGKARFREPFFDQTIDERRRLPEYRDRNRVTPLQVLFNQNAAQPCLHPSGFIFHTARCGSTLIAQMLAASPENIVISEPNILNSALHAMPRDVNLGDAEQVELFRGLAMALGVRRDQREKHYFIKFNSRCVDKLPVILRAFPDVPWIFVYRDPLEVLVAHLKHSADVLPPGVIESGLLTEDAAVLGQMRPVEFWARVLASRCAAALQFQGHGKSLLVNYRQLPAIVWEALSDFFGMSRSSEDVEHMRYAARFDAKSPSRTFSSDSETKRRAATEALRVLADRLVMPYYQELECIRLSQIA